MNHEIEELAAAVLGRSEEYWCADYIYFDDALEDEFGVNLQQFEEIARALIKFLNSDNVDNNCYPTP
jgi:hypothetical protein